MVTKENNHLSPSRQERAKPSSVCSILSWIRLQSRSGARVASCKPTQENVCLWTKSSPNALGSAHRLCLCCQKRDFSQRGCFSKKNKRCYFKLGGGRLYLDRLHKQVLADWHLTPVVFGLQLPRKAKGLVSDGSWSHSRWALSSIRTLQRRQNAVWKSSTKTSSWCLPPKWSWGLRGSEC